MPGHCLGENGGQPAQTCNGAVDEIRRGKGAVSGNVKLTLFV
jgi:hypothetical protein